MGGDPDALHGFWSTYNDGLYSSRRHAFCTCSRQHDVLTLSLRHVRSVGNEDMGVLTLEGGIKGWVKAGPQCIRLMDGYDEAYWKDLFASEKGAKATSSGPGQSETVQAGKGDMAQ